MPEQVQKNWIKRGDHDEGYMRWHLQNIEELDRMEPIDPKRTGFCIKNHDRHTEILTQEVKIARSAAVGKMILNFFRCFKTSKLQMNDMIEALQNQMTIW